MTAYEMGVVAYYQCFPLDRNPFAINTVKWEAWRDGWEDTAKGANRDNREGIDDAR